jgi:hypothetical protein
MRSILARHSRLALMSDKVFYNTSGITLIFFYAQRVISGGARPSLARRPGARRPLAKNQHRGRK